MDNQTNSVQAESKSKLFWKNLKEKAMTTTNGMAIG